MSYILSICLSLYLCTPFQNLFLRASSSYGTFDTCLKATLSRSTLTFIANMVRNIRHINFAMLIILGPIVQYGLNEYSINNPEAVKTIYRHGTHFTKSSWYSGWGVLRGRPTLFINQDPHHHAQKRCKYQTTYSMSALVTYKAYVNDCAHIFRQCLDEMFKAVTTVDMGHWFQCYAFDVISAITFSWHFDILNSDTNVDGVMKVLNKNMVYSTLVEIYLSLNTYFFSLMNRFHLSGTAEKAYLSAFINQTITKWTAERTVSAEKKAKIVNKSSDIIVSQNFLSKFLTFHSEDSTKFMNWNVQVDMIANIFTGSDIISTTLSEILYHLLKESQTFAKLCDEIDSFHWNGRILSSVMFKESQTMPYLQAVIKETQQVHLTVRLSLKRVVLKGEATLCGQFFPQGVRQTPFLLIHIILCPSKSVLLLMSMTDIQTVVDINCWVAHHNSFIFSVNEFNMNKYRSERWLVDNKERLSVMNKYYMSVSFSIFLVSLFLLFSQKNHLWSSHLWEH